MTVSKKVALLIKVYGTDFRLKVYTKNLRKNHKRKFLLDFLYTFRIGNQYYTLVFNLIGF